MLERRHGGNRKFVVSDLVATRPCVLHVARDGIEDFFVLEGSHLLFIGKVFRFRIGHGRPIEPLILFSVFSVAMHAIVGIELFALRSLFVLKHRAPGSDESRKADYARNRSHHAYSSPRAHAHDPFFRRLTRTNSKPSAKAIASAAYMYGE